LAAERRNELTAAFSKEHFDALEKFYQLLFPLDTGVRFFERDCTTLAYVYPVLKRLKFYVRDEINHTTDTEYSEHLEFLLVSFSARRRKHLDWDLIKAAFWLTSFGCQYRHDGECPIDAQFVFEYRSRRVSTAAMLPGSLLVRDPSVEPGSDEDSECPEDSLWVPPVVEEPDPPSRIYREFELDKRDVVPVLIKYLTRLMEQDGTLTTPPLGDDPWPSLEDRVEGVVSQFLCNEQWIARCRRTPTEIASQVQLWNFVAAGRGDRAYDDIAQKVISIITIPASEASCERSLSRQKRLVTHRSRSNPDLVVARMRFADFNSFVNRPQ
jgi:hypothetical protein